MRYFLLFLFMVAVLWAGIYINQHSSDVTINYVWNDNLMSATTSSAKLIFASIVSILALYVLFTVCKFLFGLKIRFKNRRIQNQVLKAKENFSQGLIHFTEGHWNKAEQLLVDNVEHSESPLLNYLTAARSAHMQEAYDRRDIYLKKASEQGSDAQIAVPVSQAEMQFSSNQLEQSRATLIHLLEVSPKHPYALKLLAKVYHQQEDWNNLFALLPDLENLSLIRARDNKKYQKTALAGMFYTLSRKKDIDNINSLWKKLPNSAQKNSELLLMYSEALKEAGDDKQSNKLIISILQKTSDEKLFEKFGLIDHENIGDSIKMGEKWLVDNSTSPMLLLALARLNRQYQLWGKSKSYFNASLNFSPSAAVYLEFAELLEELEEHENAELCYKQGLEYSIHKKGEVLHLKETRGTERVLKVVPIVDEDNFSV